MSKNNKLINSIKKVAERNRSDNVYQASNELVPQIYAGLALALHREYGWGINRISRVFAESQRLWVELGDEKMIELCEKETGITLKLGGNSNDKL